MRSEGPKTHGRLDILVNNAGIDCIGAVETLELAAWRRIMSINVDGVFLGTKTFTNCSRKPAAAPSMDRASSTSARSWGCRVFGDSAYNAGKGACACHEGVAIELRRSARRFASTPSIPASS